MSHEGEVSGDYPYQRLPDAEEQETVSEHTTTNRVLTDDKTALLSPTLLTREISMHFEHDAPSDTNDSQHVEPEDWGSEVPPQPAPRRVSVMPFRRESSRPALATNDMLNRRASATPFRRESSRAPFMTREPLSRAGSRLHSIAPMVAAVDHTGSKRGSINEVPSQKWFGKNGPGRSVSMELLETIARNTQGADWSDVAQVPEEPDHMSLMDIHYDLTRSRLKRLFMLFDPDSNGTVTYDGFRQGLEAMGIIFPQEDQFKSFLEKIDEDHSGGISYEEFQRAVQEIKLAQLFNDDFLREMSLQPREEKQAVLGTIEYSPDRIRSVRPIQHVERFIYSKKPSWASVRWIHVEGYDALTLRRLAVRYRLHPLAVEDALDADNERPKFEKYDEHSLLIIQIVQAYDLPDLKRYQRMYRNAIYMKDEDGSTSVEEMNKEELEDHLKHLKIGRLMTNPQQLSVYILNDIVISVEESLSPLWHVIKERLDTSYSKVRNSGTPFLVYSIVDACVDHLTPMSHALGAKLLMLERLLHLDPLHFDLKRLQNCSRQIVALRNLCKPLSEAIAQLQATEDFNGDIQRYFRDVQDHLSLVNENCQKHLESCRSLTDYYSNIRAGKQSEVSYLLTLVAAIFLPAQFLTGLYGMNFQYMPELHFRYGYLCWWLLVLSVAGGTFSFFHFYKRWI